MTNNLSEEIVAHTLCIGQSLIGKTQSAITKDWGNSISHPFCSLKQEEAKLDTDASILFIISKGIPFGCYFPCNSHCQLVNIPLFLGDVDNYRNYCNVHYEIHETAENSWCNPMSNTFITIFLDTEENCYMLSVMDMTDSLPHK